jgi:hypothetical protein
LIITINQTEYEITFSGDEVFISKRDGNKYVDWCSRICDILDGKIKAYEDYPFDKNGEELNKLIIKIWDNKSLI